MTQSSYTVGWGCIWFDEFDNGKIEIYSVNTKE